MSLGVAVKGPEGIVLAADSRVTLETRRPDGVVLPITFDNATKLLTFSEPHNYVGAITWGAAVIGLRTAHSFLPEIELELQKEKSRLTVQEYATRISDFFMGQWQAAAASGALPADYKGPDMTFTVGGYDPAEAYGGVFLFDIPRHPKPEPRNPGKEFGITWGGQLQVATRLLFGYDPQLITILKNTLTLNDQQVASVALALQQQLQFRIPYDILPLQDCINLAILLIRTTMFAQDLAIEIRGVGGLIEVATITRMAGVKFVQRKQIHGEPQPRKAGDDA
jgi:hypothetical protein